MNIKEINYILTRMEQNIKGTFEHCERTSMLCYAIGKELDLDYEDLELVYFAGLLHEIGKLDIPTAINNEEAYVFFTISTLNNFKDFDKIAEIILQHLENYDGSGSPNGLKGEEINFLAKILRIADFYDTQRSKGLSHDETTKLLRQYSDVYFPRRIITPFIKAIIKNDLQFEYGEPNDEE